MRLLVHDFSGHPFQVQLSRELARRGHQVLHLHCSSERTGKGALERADDDPPTFAVEAIDLGGRFSKYALVKRWLEERRYGRLVAQRAATFHPDVILASNTPLFALQRILAWTEEADVRFVLWLQDVLSIAMRRGTSRHMSVLGAALGPVFARIERRLLSRSDAVIVISDDFRQQLNQWGVDPARVESIENWAPLAELPTMKRNNPWAHENSIVDGKVLLYAGTLGMKHDPNLLLRLAMGLRERPDVTVVVVSEGLGADWLRAHAAREGLTNLKQLPFQPYERLAEVLASADILVALLEPEAGAYSVPSKVLSYHCAGRPLLAAIPEANLAARIIKQRGTGIVVDPADEHALLAAAKRLLDAEPLRLRFGARARRFAEETFDIARIGDRFEKVLNKVLEGPMRVSRGEVNDFG